MTEFKLLVTEHAEIRIAKIPNHKKIYATLEKISEDTSYFFKNARKAKDINTPSKDLQPYLMKVDGIVLVFFHNSKINTLTLATARSRSEY